VKRKCSVRPLEHADVPAILPIISGARREYGLEARVPSLLEAADLALIDTYARHRARYFVAVLDNVVVGGAGVAPLGDGESTVCELQRMYLQPLNRGQGAGTMLLSACLDAARELSFTHCYAETISEMAGAISFYERHGFQRLSAPYGNTGHGHNNCWLLRSI
jgi:putative acetyltransferase